MRRHTPLFLFVSSGALGLSQPRAPGVDDWNALNQTVHGRLFKGIPMAKPCYPGGSFVQCAGVQFDYNNNENIPNYFGGYENVSQKHMNEPRQPRYAGD